jgi:tetratricopeptide (TPR) repeat protein
VQQQERILYLADAIQATDMMIKIDPIIAVAWINKDVAFNIQGNYEEPIRCLDEAIELDPRYADA